MSIAVLGIDPGVNGGWVVLRADGQVFSLMPFRPEMTHAELVGSIRTAVGQLHVHLSRSVFMEKVQYIAGDGGQGAFTFGRVDGLIRGALHALNYPPADVTPMAWQSGMECLTGGNKNVTKNKAKELWPAVKWTHATADAALIARYGWERLRL